MKEILFNIEPIARLPFLEMLKRAEIERRNIQREEAQAKLNQINCDIEELEEGFKMFASN